MVLEPEREGWHRALMEGYGRMGERALASQAVSRLPGVLRRELGIEPAAETRALVWTDPSRGRSRSNASGRSLDSSVGAVLSFVLMFDALANLRR